MSFYYVSLFSIVPPAVAWLVLGLLFWAIAKGTRRIPHRAAVLSVVGVILLLVPLSEEIWIAWNFGQACKDAGTFINKTVAVDGFYDDSAGWGPRQLSESKYRFVESRDLLHRRLLRVELADSASRDQALAVNGDAGARTDQASSFIVRQVSEKEQIVVAPNRIDAWRVITIDKPTARYRYMSLSHIPYGHKIVAHEERVIDSETQEVLARARSFGRQAPWFFVGLDVPVKLCYGQRTVRGLLYSSVLMPK